MIQSDFHASANVLGNMFVNCVSSCRSEYSAFKYHGKKHFSLLLLRYSKCFLPHFNFYVQLAIVLKRLKEVAPCSNFLFAQQFICYLYVWIVLSGG